MDCFICFHAVIFCIIANPHKYPDVANGISYCRKEDAGTKTAKLRDEKEVLDRQQHADVEAQRNVEENLQQLSSREEGLASQDEQMQARLKKVADAHVKHTEELLRAKKKLSDFQDKHRQSRSVKFFQIGCFTPFPLCSSFGWVDASDINQTTDSLCIHVQLLIHACLTLRLTHTFISYKPSYTFNLWYIFFYIGQNLTL